jgi:large subunit ribosomal protein L23
MNLLYVIKRPLLTEKSAGESGKRVFYFEVEKSATKNQIRAALKQYFNVDATEVRTLIQRSKMRRVGKYSGRAPGWKKAMVTLKSGQSLDFFEAA